VKSTLSPGTILVIVILLSVSLYVTEVSGKLVPSSEDNLGAWSRYASTSTVADETATFTLLSLVKSAKVEPHKIETQITIARIEDKSAFFFIFYSPYATL
jgi:hypothetical protein